MGKLLALPLVLVAAVLGAIVWIFRRKAREAQAADLAAFEEQRLVLLAARKGSPEPVTSDRAQNPGDDRRDNHRANVGAE
jgi:uncharacterized protein HemX